MKHLNLKIWSFAVIFLSQIVVLAQKVEEEPEYIGENFSLEAALEIFKKSSNIEDFENNINNEKNDVTNLDLNNNGEIDYVSVESMKEGEYHSIVMYTFVGENDRQDIAVIEIEKTGDEEALLQIIGDESLYPESTIVEPFDDNEQSVKRNGPSIENPPIKVIVNVWTWRPVRFIFSPSYSIWVSPYRWHYYPKWWKPWHPIKYHIYNARVFHYKKVYHRVGVHRVVKAHKIYTPHRKTSTLVVKKGRNTTIVHKNKKGNVKVVKSKKKYNRRK